MSDQKGFSVVVLLLVSFFIILIGISFYIFPKWSKTSQISIQNNSVQKNQDDSQVNTSGIRILFANSEGKLYLSNLEGKDITPFNVDLDRYNFISSANPMLGISPDRKHLSIGAYERSQNPLQNKYHYFILSLDDRSYQEIDLGKLQTKFDYSPYPTVHGPFFWHWTEDSQNLVYSASISPEKLPGKIKRVIGLYNITKMDAEEIYSEEEFKTEFYPSVWGIIYYDPSSHLVALTDDNASSLKEAVDSNRIRGRLVDVNSRQVTSFKEPQMVVNASRPLGKYSFYTSSNQPDKCKPDPISVVLSTRPTEDLYKIDLPDNNMLYRGQVNPSLDYKVIAFEVGNCLSSNEHQFWFYGTDDKSFTKVSVADSNNHLIYSADNSQVIIESFESETKKIIWQLVNLKNENNSSDISSYNGLGRIIYWY